MKDIHTDHEIVQLIPAAAYAADNIPAAVGISGFEAAEIVLEVGVGGITFDATNKIEIKLTHADTETGDYSAVTADDLIGLASVGSGGIVKSLVEEHAVASVDSFGYRGNKPWLKLLADFAGTHEAGDPAAAAPTVISAVIIKSRPHHA